VTHPLIEALDGAAAAVDLAECKEHNSEQAHANTGCPVDLSNRAYNLAHREAKWAGVLPDDWEAR